MDTVATCIQATVFDPTSGTNQILRFTNRNDPRATTFNNQAWLPVLESAPTVGISVFDGAFQGQATVALGSMTLTLVDGLIDAWATYAWGSALIEIYAGDMVAGTISKIYTASADGATRKGRVQLEIGIQPMDEILNQNVLYLGYAGTGGQEGDVDIKGVPKPMVFGYAQFCKAILIDSVRQIYQVHGYGEVNAIDAVYEGGQTLGAAYADYTAAQFATFQSVVIPGGTWVRCKQLGMFRLANKPSFPVTATVHGDTGGVAGGAALTRMADVLNRALNLVLGFGMLGASQALFNTNVPAPQDLYLTEQVSLKDLFTQMLSSVGGYYLFDESTNLILGLVRFGTSTLTLDGDNGQLPDVMGINQLATSAPVWLLSVGGVQCHYVHSSSDIVGALDDLSTDIDTLNTSKNKIFNGSGSPPTGAIDGDLWPDTSVNPTTLRRFDGTSSTWISISTYGASGAEATNISTLLARVNSISTDSVLDRSEKPDAIRMWSDAGNEYYPVVNQAGVLGISHTALDTAFSNLANYLNSIPGGWNNTSTDSPIVRATWNSTWNAFETALITLQTAIDAATAQGTPFFNLAKFPEFEGGQKGWSLLYNPSGLSVGWGAANFQNHNYFYVNITFTAANQLVSYGTDGAYKFSVVGGAKLLVSACVQATNNTSYRQVIIWYLKSDGTASSIKANDSLIVNGNAFIDWASQAARIAFFAVAPADASKAFIEVYIKSTGPGLNNSAMWQPMVMQVPAGQTTLPPFSGGINSDDGADITGNNTANNTANVGSITSGSVTTTVKPGGGLLSGVVSGSGTSSGGVGSFGTSVTTIRSLTMPTPASSASKYLILAAGVFSVDNGATDSNPYVNVGIQVDGASAFSQTILRGKGKEQTFCFPIQVTGKTAAFTVDFSAFCSSGPGNSGLVTSAALTILELKA